MELDLRTSRRTFSRVGFGLALILVATVYAQGIWILAAELIWGESNWTMTTKTGMWLSNFVPMYLIGFPAGILLMLWMPRQVPHLRIVSHICCSITVPC